MSSASSSTPSPRGNDGRKVQRSIRHFFSGPDPPRASSSSNSPSTKPKAPPASAGAAQQQKATSFPALEVVWAKFSTYPPWPALVCPEPVEGGRRVGSNGGDVHVQFFDEHSSHAWVEVGAVEKFRGSADSAMMASAKKKGRWTKALTRAVKEAEVAGGMSAAKRRDLLVDHKKVDGDGSTDNASDDDGHLDERRRRPKKRKTSAAKIGKSKAKVNDSETKENEFDEENNIVFYHDPEEEEMSEYDKIRQKNIEERQRKFQELQLNEAKTRLSDSLNLAKKAKPSTSRRGLAAIKKEQSNNEPVRRSLRQQKIEAETGLKLPDKEPTLLHWAPQVCNFKWLLRCTFK